MKKPVKIRYERQSGKGANLFLGMTYFDDGSKEVMNAKKLAGLDLPVEHEGLSETMQQALVRFPMVPVQTPLPSPFAPVKRPPPLWPLNPRKK
jgi:hypothetical protein